MRILWAHVYRETKNFRYKNKKEEGKEVAIWYDIWWLQMWFYHKNKKSFFKNKSLHVLKIFLNAVNFSSLKIGFQAHFYGLKNKNHFVISKKVSGSLRSTTWENCPILKRSQPFLFSSTSWTKKRTNLHLRKKIWIEHTAKSSDSKASQKVLSRKYKMFGIMPCDIRKF